MRKKNTPAGQLSAKEQQLVQRLREHPNLIERFQSILEISANAQGPIKSADEIEGLLVEELRRLGNSALGDWASRAEQRLGEELEQKDASARVRKKKR